MFDDGVVVKYGQADKAHENEFFRYFAKSIKAYFDKKGIRACLLGMPTCLVNDRLQIDALLITSKTITIVDFKDYGGQLLLPEEAEFRRGSWVMDSGLQVRGGSSPNPFYQTGLQRDRLMKILELTCRNRSTFDPHHISTVICFQQAVEVQGSIPGRYRPFFHIADADTFLEKLFDIVCAGRDDAGLLEPKFIDYFNKKVFQATEYDLSVSPESLGITRFVHAIEDTAAREAAVPVDAALATPYEDRLKEFINGDSPVLIVSGTTGSGKTSLVPHVRGVALETGFSSARIFGLSNRVIANLLSSVDEVESLYSALFDFSATKVEENGAQLIPLADLVNESPFEDLAETPEEDGKSVFIVCEAQMVTDALREDEMLRFGSGRLLSDLLSHLGIDKDSGNKVVFVGDKYELSFGSWSDSCLNPDWYRGSIDTEEIELPDTTNPNGIQAACLDIADAIRTGRMTNLVLEQNEQVRICEPKDEAPLLRDASDNWRRHKVLSYTNGQAQGLNGYIKRRIAGSGSRCAVGDVVIFDNQVTAPPSEAVYTDRGFVPQFGDQEPRRINTGEFATITSLGGSSGSRIVLSERVPHSDSPVVLTLVPATVRLESSKLGEEYRIHYIEELLESGEPKLDFQQEMALQIHLKALMDAAASEHPFERSPQYAEMMEKDDYQLNKNGRPMDKSDARYLTVYEKQYRAEMQRSLLSGDAEYSKWVNAARIRYGWCMTVHKSMSYTFNEVTFSPRTDGGRTNEGYLRFLYTGISRARERVNLVRWVPISPFEKTDFGKAEVGASASRKRPSILASTRENVSADINKLVQASLPQGARLASSKSANYQEIFEIERGGSVAKVIFDYSGDAKVKPPRLATGDKDLFSDFRTSVEQAASRDGSSEASGIDWLYSFIQEKVLPSYTVQLESTSPYRDVVRLEVGVRSITVRVDHKKNGSISSFKLLSGEEAAYREAVDMIRAYYRLDNE
jgi:hypothetical protein